MLPSSTFRCQMFPSSSGTWRPLSWNYYGQERHVISRASTSGLSRAVVSGGLNFATSGPRRSCRRVVASISISPCSYLPPFHFNAHRWPILKHFGLSVSPHEVENRLGMVLSLLSHPFLLDPLLSYRKFRSDGGGGERETFPWGRLLATPLCACGHRRSVMVAVSKRELFAYG